MITSRAAWGLNVLHGDVGHDMLDPGRGQDTSYGGTGDDFYLIYGESCGPGYPDRKRQRGV